ncbi:MAG: hypothetical protein CM15mP120_15020 [Pseudomonadota bacterium]|nr:MAG: hypothetical protein CM15mP120_15020 [Pseudomonadota bacterium]
MSDSQQQQSVQREAALSSDSNHCFVCGPLILLAWGLNSPWMEISAVASLRRYLSIWGTVMLLMAASSLVCSTMSWQTGCGARVTVFYRPGRHSLSKRVDGRNASALRRLV